MRKLPFSKTHLSILIVFHLALYLPMIGRGLVFDDFHHVYSAAYEPLEQGLTRVQGGPFFNPLAWLTFKADWLLWEGRSFPMAVENLLVHVGNVLALYFLTLALWQSEVAAWWAASGFAVLFPANTWAVMYIATRAHVLSALFYLGALIAAVWYVRTLRHRIAAGLTTVACAALAMFAKESGITVVAAVFVMLAYERRSRDQRTFRRRDVLLLIGLAGVVAIYLGLRSQSGAVSPGSPNENYDYALSLSRLADNLLRYVWRTYGLLAIAACAIGFAQWLRGLHPHVGWTSRDVVLSIALFAIAVGPFALLSVRSATYSYLPGIGAALLLGAVARSLYAAPEMRRPPRLKSLASFPIVLVVASFIALTIGQSVKWVLMGEVSRTVLEQIAMQQSRVEPKSSVVLQYAEEDRAHRFPDAFPGGVFTYAVRLLYRDPSMDGKIVRRGEPYSIAGGSAEIRFEYLVIDNEPRVRLISGN